MKKFRTHSDTLRDIGREDVAEALDKKKFKEKLLKKLWLNTKKIDYLTI